MLGEDQMLQLGWVSWGNQLHVWCCEPGARCSPRHGLLGSPVGCRAMKLPSIPRTVTEHGDLWDEAQRDAEGACKMGMGGSGVWGAVGMGGQWGGLRSTGGALRGSKGHWGSRRGIEGL